MGLEVIRDVVVRVSLQLGDANQLGRAAETATAQFAKFEMIQKRIIDNERTHNSLIREKSADFSKILNQLELMTISLEKMVTYQRQFAEIGIKNPNTGGGGGGGGDGGGGAGGGLMAGGNPLLRVATATITVLHAPRMILGFATEMIEGLKAEFKGGDEADEKGFFTAPGRKFLEAIGAMEEKAGDRAKKELDAVTKIIGLEQSRIALINEANRKELDSAKERLSLAKQEESRIKSAIEAEKQRIETAKQDFGLMNAGEQQTIKDIANKITKDGGIGNLSDQEIEFARKFGGFKPLFGEFAGQNADAGGFADLLKQLGADKKLTKLEADFNVNAELQTAINIEIKDINKMADDIAKRLEPWLTFMTNAMTAKIGSEVNEIIRKIRHREL